MSKEAVDWNQVWPQYRDNIIGGLAGGALGGAAGALAGWSQRSYETPEDYKSRLRNQILSGVAAGGLAGAAAPQIYQAADKYINAPPGPPSLGTKALQLVQHNPATVGAAGGAAGGAFAGSKLFGDAEIKKTFNEDLKASQLPHGPPPPRQTVINMMKRQEPITLSPSRASKIMEPPVAPNPVLGNEIARILKARPGISIHPEDVRIVGRAANTFLNHRGKLLGGTAGAIGGALLSGFFGDDELVPAK